MSIRDYLGIPYEVGGTPPTRADCYSLVRHYATHEKGFYLPPYMYEVDNCYACAAMFIAEADRQMSTLWKRVDKQPDAVVVFRVAGLVMHCGIMINHHEFLHAFKGRDSCVESLDDFYWKKRVEGFFIYG
jgi:cell wall-associated NlpC family hydrolase